MGSRAGKLAAAETGRTVSKRTYREALPALRVDLLNAQFDLRDKPRSLLVLIEGDDRAGINRVLKALHEWMDGRYMVTRAFDVNPERERRGQPPFARFWRPLPAQGSIALFCKAWTLDAIAERLVGDLDDAGLARYVAHIRAMETALVDAGCALLKLWLHLPGSEFRSRLRSADARLWRLPGGKKELRKRYAEGIALAERVVAATDQAVPWQIVESTDPRHRDLAVGRAVLRALRDCLDEPEPVRSTPHLAPGHGSLASIDLSKRLGRDAYKKRLETGQRRMREVGESLRDAGTSGVLVFQGFDAAGKGGAIRRMLHELDPQDYRVAATRAPSDEERAHPWLWRFWRALPPPGTLWVLDRSWYGRVLVERVEGFARPDEWQHAYAEINDFEAQLAEHGMPIAKFWLQVDADEQLRRFEQRAATPYKKYKLTDEDLRNREKRPAYEVAADEMIANTDTPHAPWYLIPANDKRFARVRVLELACETLERALP